jgi:small nuclear ribonucleoprotein (snRNP)-like protein
MNSTITSDKIEINKRMIGKTVNVLCKDGSSWIGEVTGVVDETTLYIFDGEGNSHEIDIFDIRSVN